MADIWNPTEAWRQNLGGMQQPQPYYTATSPNPAEQQAAARAKEAATQQIGYTQLPAAQHFSQPPPGDPSYPPGHAWNKDMIEAGRKAAEMNQKAAPAPVGPPAPTPQSLLPGQKVGASTGTVPQQAQAPGLQMNAQMPASMQSLAPAAGMPQQQQPGQSVEALRNNLSSQQRVY